MVYFIKIFVIIGCFLFLGACNNNSSVDVSLSDQISYNLHVRAILSDNCFACHGPDANKREAGLRLDIAEDAYRALTESPNAHGIIPGNPKSSEVFLRITTSDENERMPPIESNLSLTNIEIKTIEKWIKQGAKYEPHWAFVPPVKAKMPKLKLENWAESEIDYFILSKMEESGIEPNMEADKEMLLKRVSLDITGLPPSEELMNRFLDDNDESAYIKLVDELLDSKAFGEHMAMFWMDIARYADTHGYQDDYYRTQWPWRDWVIHAFNENLSFDQFITWQLAGDLLPDATKEQLLATGFNRNHKITEESGAIDEEYRVGYVIDRTNTIGKALIGITMECAQCHDHKYDPIAQKEYFQLFAFFNSVAEFGIEEESPGFSKKSPAKYPLLDITDEDVNGILSFINKPDSTELVKPILGLKKGRNFDVLESNASNLRVSIMGDLESPRTTYVLERGDYEAYGEEVLPGTPEQILRFNEHYPKNRIGLSKWLFDADNPLTSRVFVNRVWQNIFGKGLVSTPGDFGMQGSLPSHPELLDWISVDFMENGWNVKRLIKQIVLSSTYKQSSVLNSEIEDLDPENFYYSRFPRNRIPAENIRDLVLSSSGLLVPIVGGPSVKPYQPEGLWELASSGRGNTSEYVQDTGVSLYRRGLYTFVKRTVPPPTMILFDSSNRDECEVERNPTNTPLQALVMMNDPTVLEASRVFASKLLNEGSPIEVLIEHAFIRIVNRRPEDRETKVLNDYFHETADSLSKNNGTAEKILDIGEYPQDSKIDVVKHAALMQVISLIYNMEETITKS